MKKILLLSLGLALASASFAQNSTVFTMKSDIDKVSDTVTNSGTAYVQLLAQSTYEQISIEAVVTKISGTVAGYVLLSGSVDGTNFINLNTDTLSNTDVTTNKKIWVLTGNKYLYYRLTATGSGTMAASIKGYVLGAGQKTNLHTSFNMKSATNYDTVVVNNTSTKYVTLQLQSWYTSTNIQVVVTKLSGTAGGTVTIQGSNDGTNYVTVDTNYSTAQTLSVANQTTNTKFFILTGSPYSYYRASYTGTGTMSCRIRAYLLPNK